MNQMPELASLEAEDVLTSIQRLLDWKENKSLEIKQGLQEEVRRLTTERDTADNKCHRLEQRVQILDKQSYTLEFKVKELEESARNTKRTSLNDIRGQAANKAGAENQLKKSQMELKKAEKTIERLQEQLDKAYGKHKRPSALNQPKSENRMSES